MQENLNVYEKENKIKKYFYYFLRMHLFFLILFIFFRIILKKEIKNLLNFSIENQKKIKKKQKKKEISDYNYDTLLILSAIPITNCLAIDRFYIGNKYALTKLIINVIFNFPTLGLVGSIFWIIDLVKVLNCTMIDKYGKVVCANNNNNNIKNLINFFFDIK